MKKLKIKTPRLALWIIEKLSHKNFYTAVSGDCEEMYEYLYNRYGRFKAKRWIWKQAVKSCPVFFCYFVTWKHIMF